jgi:hypothetical protein
LLSQLPGAIGANRGFFPDSFFAVVACPFSEKRNHRNCYCKEKHANNKHIKQPIKNIHFAEHPMPSNAATYPIKMLAMLACFHGTT